MAKRKVEEGVLFPKVGCKVFTGDKPLTASKAKELLGWREAAKDEEVMLRDLGGRKIHTERNTKNRTIRMSRVYALQQEILRKRWSGPNGVSGDSTVNGETIIIGKTGQILSGQKQLIALVLASQEWQRNRANYPQWSQEPCIDKIVVVGIDEGDATANTIDICQPRDLTDVIERSYYFASIPRSERRALSGMAAFGTRFVWDRTGIADAYSISKNHSEMLAFIEDHPKIIDCVKHVYEEDGEGHLKQFVQTGTASGILYLQGCCTSDGAKYRETRNESSLDWEEWEKACEFWVLLLQNAKELQPVRKALGQLMEADEGGHVSNAMRVALLVKAWNAFRLAGRITPGDITLELVPNELGVVQLAEIPSIGGIDTVDDADIVDPSPEEIEQRAAAERSKRDGWEPSKRERVYWVDRTGREPEIMTGKVLKLTDTHVYVRIAPGCPQAGTSTKIPREEALREQPTPADLAAA